MTLFDEHGNKTAIPNKERQIEALQLLFLLLPQANRSLLKLLLDLLYHTAKQQDKNKMSAFNLALMFAPHVLWPKHVRSASVCNCIVRIRGPGLRQYDTNYKSKPFGSTAVCIDSSTFQEKLP